ncbi:unnamed protein product, partial [marine sediment metagenome]
GFCILFLVAGIWRHQQAELEITNNELRRYNDLEQKITLIGQIIREPDIREENIKLTIKPDNIEGKVIVEETKVSSPPFANARLIEFKKIPPTKERQK